MFTAKLTEGTVHFSIVVQETDQRLVFKKKFLKRMYLVQHEFHKYESMTYMNTKSLSRF